MEQKLTETKLCDLLQEMWLVGVDVRKVVVKLYPHAYEQITEDLGITEPVRFKYDSDFGDVIIEQA